MVASRSSGSSDIKSFRRACSSSFMKLRTTQFPYPAASSYSAPSGYTSLESCPYKRAIAVARHSGASRNSGNIMPAVNSPMDSSVSQLFRVGHRIKCRACSRIDTRIMATASSVKAEEFRHRYSALGHVFSRRIPVVSVCQA